MNNLDGCSASITLQLIQNIIITAGSSSDDFFKQEDSTQNPLDGALSGLETEDTLPTTTASDVLHPVLVPSSERERTLEEESSHHTGIRTNSEL